MLLGGRGRAQAKGGGCSPARGHHYHSAGAEFTDDDTIFQTEGSLPDGRAYRAELWQLDSYDMTIFIPQGNAETAAEATMLVETTLIEFCGTRYQRTEPVHVNGELCWSYNVVVCDAEEQFVSRLPLIGGVAEFSIWFGERQVSFKPVSAA